MYRRFIPIDSAIPSISQHVLKNFHKTYDAFGLETRRILLGKVLPSSRDWNRAAEDTIVKDIARGDV